MQLARCRITRAQYYVNWDVRVQDVILSELPVSSGYGFVDFDSPSAAQKAVTALKSSGIQAQMAKVRLHGRMILRAPPLRWTFGIDTLNYGSYSPNSDKCWPYSLSVASRIISIQFILDASEPKHNIVLLFPPDGCSLQISFCMWPLWKFKCRHTLEQYCVTA